MAQNNSIILVVHDVSPNKTYWLGPSEITGSAVALHCCKTHRKKGILTPCEIVTPENFSSKVCTRDYVGDGNYCANFRENQFSEGFSPNRWNITPLWLFLTVLSCPVLFFFSILCPGRTVGPIFTLYGSNDVFPRKEVPFGGYNDGWRHLGKTCPLNPKKVGVNRQFQAKMPKYEYCSISKTVNPIKPEFED